MKLQTKQWILLALMLVSAGLGAALKPTIFVSDLLPAVDLQAMVPKDFGEWHELPVTMTQVINPQQQETLERIYSETLSRTYGNAQGYRVMLSIAYGKNQNKALELHSPEVCYPAQGFTLIDAHKTTLDILGKTIPANQIETSQGQRFEPVTFWSAVGTTVPATLMQKRFVEFRYAITGRIPDGFLVRVSSIDKDTPNAYAMQARFAHDLMQAIAPQNQPRFVGDFAMP
jgi:EpsI family protein